MPRRMCVRPRNAEALKAISAQAVVNMPLMEQGGIVALLYLNDATAREWRNDELALVGEVAERTRMLVAAAALRPSGSCMPSASSLERQVEEAQRPERDRALVHPARPPR